MKIEVIRGPWTKADTEVVISMRMSIFKEWPYLYIGDRKTESQYVAPYAKSSNSLIITAKKEGRVIGLVTGIPLVEMDESFTSPFTKASMPIQSIYYLGEIMLLKEFRGRGIGSQIYTNFENEVKIRSRFTDIAIVRMRYNPSDLRRPKDYKPLDEFWDQLGFVEQPNLSFCVPYQEIGGAKKTDHFFCYSLKSLLINRAARL